MTTGKLDRRTGVALGLGVAAVLILRFGVFADRQPAVLSGTNSVPLAEKRLARLRQVAAGVPGKEAVLKQVTAELTSREKGMVQADTAAQAEAQLLETVRRLASAEGIDARGAEELRVRPLARDYGEVSAVVTFNCRVEQLVNLLASLANEPTLLATNEIRISSANAKDKMLGVRLGLSAVVPRKLVPEKKGAASF